MKKFPLALTCVAFFVLCAWIALQFYQAAFGEAPEGFEALAAAARYTRLLAILGVAFGLWLGHRWTLAFTISLVAAIPLLYVAVVLWLAMLANDNLEHEILINLFLMSTALPVFSAMGSAVGNFLRKRKKKRLEKQQRKQRKKNRKSKQNR